MTDARQNPDHTELDRGLPSPPQPGVHIIRGPAPTHPVPRSSIDLLRLTGAKDATIRRAEEIARQTG